MVRERGGYRIPQRHERTMELSLLLRLPRRMHVRQLIVEPAVVTVEVAARHCPAPCPACRTPSHHVHSYYTRTVADLPCSGRHVRLRLQVRKLRCTNARCPRHIFAERFPAYRQPRARKTVRVAHLIAELGLLVGGRGAERIGRLLCVRVSDSTALRMVMAHD